MIEEAVISRVLGTALRTGGDFAEVFAEDKRSSSAVLDDGKVEELTSGRDRGAGIRVVVGDTTGFAHTADLSEAGPRAPRPRPRPPRPGAAAAAPAPSTSPARRAPAPNVIEIYPGDVAQGPQGRAAAPGPTRSPGPQGRAITQVSASYGDSRRRILVANSDGLLAERRPGAARCSRSSCVATGDTGMQTGRESVGHTVGFELFDRYDVEELARAGRRPGPHQARRPARRRAAQMPVVIGSGGGGVLFHEACGHGLEADLVAKGASVFTGRVGEQVASPLVTLVDDGTMAGEWGSFAIDDEGHPAQRNVLIEDGVLTDYMWDLLRARKEGRRSSGNGRRQSYQHLPMVRMTNTYLLDGDDDPDDIVADTDRRRVRGRTSAAARSTPPPATSCSA